MCDILPFNSFMPQFPSFPFTGMDFQETPAQMQNQQQYIKMQQSQLQPQMQIQRFEPNMTGSLQPSFDPIDDLLDQYRTSDQQPTQDQSAGADAQEKLRALKEKLTKRIPPVDTYAKVLTAPTPPPQKQSSQSSPLLASVPKAPKAMLEWVAEKTPSKSDRRPSQIQITPMGSPIEKTSISKAEGCPTKVAVQQLITPLRTAPEKKTTPNFATNPELKIKKEPGKKIEVLLEVDDQVKMQQPASKLISSADMPITKLAIRPAKECYPDSHAPVKVDTYFRTPRSATGQSPLSPRIPAVLIQPLAQAPCAPRALLNYLPDTNAVPTPPCYNCGNLDHATVECNINCGHYGKDGHLTVYYFTRQDNESTRVGGLGGSAWEAKLVHRGIGPGGKHLDGSNSSISPEKALPYRGNTKTKDGIIDDKGERTEAVGDGMEMDADNYWEGWIMREDKTRSVGEGH